MNKTTWDKWRGFWDRHPVMAAILIMPVILCLVLVHMVMLFKRKFFQFE